MSYTRFWGKQRHRYRGKASRKASTNEEDTFQPIPSTYAVGAVHNGQVSQAHRTKQAEDAIKGAVFVDHERRLIHILPEVHVEVTFRLYERKK